MQIVVLIAIALPFLWVTLSYILAWFDKINPLENLSSAVVTVTVSAILGYIVQNCSRAKWFGDKTETINTSDKLEDEDSHSKRGE